MSYRKFKFISPGIFITEIDNSQLPKQPTAMGPAIIGRLAQGPALHPVQVDSLVDFLEIFGKPIPGGQGGDIWRYGNFTAPTYAAYAAQAWLRNNSPVTMVRLLGQTHADAAASTAYAGWTTTKTAGTTDATTNGGAFGLFIAEKDTTAPFDPVISATGSGVVPETDLDAGGSQASGTLAAIWYLNNGSIALSGQNISTGSTCYTKGMATWIQAVESGPTFKVVIQDSAGAAVTDASFNFDNKSPRFIRKAFNTNPTLTNSTLYETGSVNYWLGESFEGDLLTMIRTDQTGIKGTTPSQCYGIILNLSTPDGTIPGGDFRMGPGKSPAGQNAKTGWFISQDVGGESSSYSPANMQKLFRFCARELGEETQRKIKISISRIKVSSDTSNPYGSFSVLVRDIRDTDAAPKILEQYNNCDLNPASNNYIAKKIGNKFQQWSDDDRRYRYYGDYTNISDYVRVEVNEAVDRATTTAEYLPFGVFGPPRYKGFSVGPTGSLGQYGDHTTQIGNVAHSAFVLSSSLNPITGPTTGLPTGRTFASATFSPSGTTAGDVSLHGPGTFLTAKYRFPQLRLRRDSGEGSLSDQKDAFFGVDTTYSTTHNRFDPSVYDLLRTKADDISGLDANDEQTENSWVFSLDDVRNNQITDGTSDSSYTAGAIYESGSRVAGTSYTAHTRSSNGPPSASYRNVIDDNSSYGGTTAGWNQFTTCLHGGADGVDITEMDPFNNRVIEGKTEVNNSAYNSINVAIDSLRDPEIVEYNLVTMPGVTNNTLNTKLVEVCEKRADALAIIDLKNGYQPKAESGGSRTDRKGNLSNVVNNMTNDLLIDSSYGCAYYPWVQIRDTINGAVLWAPPSVAALGAMSYGEATSQLWFAPAGFTRGGLSTNRAAGVPVVGVEQRLTSKERDKLYDANINPIASFPAEGIVIFGQKTLQLTPSALDRINVRRLVIFLKKQISRFAATILFDQNVQTTWNRFKSKVEPFLSSVKAGLGITEYKLILDETTTTPDLIDRNIMYAKIYVKPARAIEFIAIDFIITDSGASFED